MRVVIVGGGMAGLALARACAARGLPAFVLERAPAGTRVPGPIMLPYQAFDTLRDIGIYDSVRAAGRDIAVQADGNPVAIGVGRQELIDQLAEGVEVHREREVVELLHEGERVVGLRARGPDGERELAADLVVGADGSLSPVRAMAGIEAEVRPAPGAALAFRSPVRSEEAFSMRYQADGRQVTLLDWPGGSAGSWQIDRIGREAALAPGLEAYKRGFARLLPQAAPALEAVTALDQLIYREPIEVRCESWWRPGAVLIGEAAHAINPETGVGSGLGFGDALALAVAIAGARDPDGACRDYEFWRRPAIAPYEQVGTASVRLVRGGERPPEERWPPVI